MKRSSTILLCAMVSVVCLVLGREASAVQLLEFQGHLYGLSDTTYSTWTAAEGNANSLGGHLVSITSVAEQSFIESMFLSGSSSTSVYWIGITDVAQEGVYQWSSGESVSFRRWAPGEPDNFGSGEDYSIINWQFGRGGGAKGDWSDVAVTGNFGFGGVNAPYLAMIEIVPVPEPASLTLVGLGITGLVLVRWRAKRPVPGTGGGVSR